MISYFSSRIDLEERSNSSVYPNLTKEDICKDICDEKRRKYSVYTYLYQQQQKENEFRNVYDPKGIVFHR